MSQAATTAPAHLPALVRTAFARARAEGELLFFPTRVALLPVGGVPFQVRFAPALADKPRQDAKDQDQEAGGDKSRDNKHDPFAQPPASLYVAGLGPAHYLVLNKFAIVPEHFILATRDFRPQTHVLERADLEAARACIRAYDDDEDGGLFAFFNSGPHSGASQPHRHIQLLPVARMRDGLPPGGAWAPLAERLDLLARAPFVAFAEPLAPHADLYAAYLRLYRRACRAVAAHGEEQGGGERKEEEEEGKKEAEAEEEAPAEGEARISYNLAMTSRALVVCPRMADGAPVPGGGRLALNGTLLAGTALVKSEAEWEALRARPPALAAVLAAAGLPRR